MKLKMQERNSVLILVMITVNLFSCSRKHYDEKIMELDFKGVITNIETKNCWTTIDIVTNENEIINIKNCYCGGYGNISNIDEGDSILKKQGDSLFFNLVKIDSFLVNYCDW